MPMKMPLGNSMGLRLGACLLTGLTLLMCAGQAQAQFTEVQSAAKQVKTAGPGTYYLEMDADIPPNLGTNAVRYTVWAGDKMQIEKMGRQWDANQTPYFTIDRHNKQAQAKGKNVGRFRYVWPVKVKKGQTVRVTYPKKGGSFFKDEGWKGKKPWPTVEPKWEGKIYDVHLRPAIEGLKASMSTKYKHNVFFRTEKPQSKVELTGPAGKAFNGRLVLASLKMANSLGGNNWSPDVRVTEARRLETKPVEINFNDEGKASLNVDIPTDANRLVGLTLMLKKGDKRWNQFLGTVAVVPQRDTSKWNQSGVFLVSPHLGIRKGKPYSRATSFGPDVLLAALKKSGFDWVRQPFFWSMWEPEKGEVTWKQTDMMMNLLRKNKINLMHIVGPVPRWARVKPTDEMIKTGYKGWKVDTTPAPKYLDAFEKAHEKFFKRYKDMVRATNVWNEPWEGFGITGWMATGSYYRKIVRRIDQAAQAADPKIKVIAADSPHNTQWKLFSAGMEDSIDAISTHYMDPMAGHAFSLGKYYNKEVWETETWLAWQGDAKSVHHALSYLALGGDRISLWHPDMLFSDQGFPTTSMVWAAATQKLLHNTKFDKFVHPGRPPFALMFKNQKNNRQVAAILDNLSSLGHTKREIFRWQFMDDQIQMTLPNNKNFKFYDTYGNPVDAEKTDAGPTLTVGNGTRYIEFRGPIDKFEKILDQATYKGMTPVEVVIPSDLTTRWSAGPKLHIQLRNAYNQPITGQLQVKVDGFELAQSSKQIELSPAEQKTFTLPVTKRTTEANRFPVTVDVKTDHGNAHYTETIHQALIVPGSPTIDGKTDDWKKANARPVTMSANPSELKASLAQQAWRPWEDFAGGTKKFTAQMSFAYDDQNLYLTARVLDDSKNILPSMLAGKELNVFQKGAKQLYAKPGPIPGKSGDMILWSMGYKNVFDRKYELFPPESPLATMGSVLRHHYQYMIYPTKNGEAEVLRVRTPSFYYMHPFPIDYAWMAKHCKVDGAKVHVTRQDKGYVYEVALPWSELSKLPHKAGTKIRMNVAVQNKSSSHRLTWAAGRSLSTKSKISFEPAWQSDWSNETWWKFVGASSSNDN